MATCSACCLSPRPAPLPRRPPPRPSPSRRAWPAMVLLKQSCRACTMLKFVEMLVMHKMPLCLTLALFSGLRDVQPSLRHEVCVLPGKCS